MLLLSRAANTTPDTTSASVDQAAGGGLTVVPGAPERPQLPQPLLTRSFLSLTHWSPLMIGMARTVGIGRMGT